MVKFYVTDEMFSSFPSFQVAVLHAKGINNNGLINDVSDIVQASIEQTQQIIKGIEVRKHPAIACWFKAYAQFGTDARSYPSSIEALLRRVRNSGVTRRINTLVDVYNSVSIKYLLPVGADDLGKVSGNLGFRVANGSEPFMPLGGNQMEVVPKGEVIYADEEKVLCRRWNWRQSDVSKITEGTTEAVLTVQAMDEERILKTQTIAYDLAGLISKFCGGTTDVHIINNSSRYAELE